MALHIYNWQLYEISYTFSCIKKSNVKGIHILSRLAIYCVIFLSPSEKLST